MYVHVEKQSCNTKSSSMSVKTSEYLAVIFFLLLVVISFSNLRVLTERGETIPLGSGLLTLVGDASSISFSVNCVNTTLASFNWNDCGEVCESAAEDTFFNFFQIFYEENSKNSVKLYLIDYQH